jgi:hypothetical protein
MDKGLMLFVNSGSILVKISFPKKLKIPNIYRRSWTIPDLYARIDPSVFQAHKNLCG